MTFAAHSPFAGKPQSHAGRGLGWHLSPPKPFGAKPDRTIAALSLPTTPPAMFSNTDLVPEIIDQGALGSCVPNSGSLAIRASQILQLVSTGIASAQVLANPPPLISRLMDYWLPRAFWHQQAEDSGTYIRTFYEMLNVFGFCEEKFWPYDISKFALRPSTMAFEMAFDQRLGAKRNDQQIVVYSRITSTGAARVTDCKRAIASRKLVHFGTSVTENLCSSNYDFSKPVQKPRADEKIAGGHAMVLESYNDADQAFGIPMTWSTGFANAGRFKMSYEYITWDQTDDLWVIDSSPYFSELVTP